MNKVRLIFFVICFYMFFMHIVSAVSSEEAPSVKIISEKFIDKIDFSLCVPETFKVSPDNRRIAYVSYTKEGHFLVKIDGTLEKTFDKIGEELHFSPNSEYLAYIVGNDKKMSMVINGEEGEFYDKILPNSVLFSPNSKHLAYIAEVGGKMCLILDGEKSKPYNIVAEPVFSQDSEHLAYTAEDEGKQFVVLDNKELKKYDKIASGNLKFSPDSQILSWVAGKDNKQFLVLGDKEQKAYGGIDGCVFSPDSKRIAYGAYLGDKWLMIIDNKESMTYDAIKCVVVFSPDSKSFAYAVADGGKEFVIVNGRSQNKYDAVYSASISFSPDSQRLAYVAKKNGKLFVVVDGIEQQGYDGIHPKSLTFSPNSRSLSYIAQNKTKNLLHNKQFVVVSQFIVLDGKELKLPTEEIGSSNLTFSEDSKHLIYIGADGNKNFIVTDKKATESIKYDTIVVMGGGSFVFDSSDNIHYLAVKDNKIYLVKEKINWSR